MTLPTFIIAGASKSGSTSLWMYLKAHPQICITPYRATRFFTQELGLADGGVENGPLLSGRYAKGLNWYQSLFQECQGADAVGEVTLSYMASSDAPKRIYQIIPDVSLLFILRDPVDRMYSHYWEERKGGLDLPDFETMVEENHPRYQRYSFVSSYHLHLTRYLEIFPSRQISVYLHDDLREDSLGVVHRMYEAVGVDASFTPSNIDTRFNPAGITRVAWLQRMMHSSAAMKLSTEMPLWLYQALQGMRQRLIRLNTLTVGYPPMRPELRGKMVAGMDDSITYVEQLLSRSLPSWRKV